LYCMSCIAASQASVTLPAFGRTLGVLSIEARAAAPRCEGYALKHQSRTGQEVVNSFPVLFLIVGLSVLFLRVEDRDAWWMMLVFATASLLPACPTSVPAPRRLA